MELNEYQEKAMGTCFPACENMVYMLNGLTAEVGEINDKVANWVRKGIAQINGNQLYLNVPNCEEYRQELIKEVGDCAWFIAGLSMILGASLEEVCQTNLDKIAERKMNGTIITHTDH